MDCIFISSAKAHALQFSIYPYLGVGYLSSAIKKEGFSSELYDIDVCGRKLNKLYKKIDEGKPFVIAYSIMSLSLDIFYKITLGLQKKYPNLIIVAGGPHVTNHPEIISKMGIDYGFVGHSEDSFPKFLKILKSGNNNFDDIEGIVIPKINRIDKPILFDVSKTDLSPNYDIYDFSKYQNIFYGRKWFSVITTRGCPFNCKFCKDPGKNRYQEYPLDLVKNQIKFLIDDKKLKWLSFVDDTFTYNRNRVIELCEWIISENLKFKWACCARADTLDEELIEIMKAAGLSYTVIGVEVGNEGVRKRINKNILNSQYINIINILKKHKIRVLSTYVLGNPKESYKEIFETIRFSNKLKADYVQYYNLTSLPQSPIFKYGVDEKVFGEDIWTKYMKSESGLPYYVPEGLSLKRLKRIRIYAFFRYYLRPKKFFDLGFRMFKFFIDVGIRNKVFSR